MMMESWECWAVFSYIVGPNAIRWYPLKTMFSSLCVSTYHFSLFLWEKWGFWRWSGSFAFMAPLVFMRDRLEEWSWVENSGIAFSPLCFYSWRLRWFFLSSFLFNNRIQTFISSHMRHSADRKPQVHDFAPLQHLTCLLIYGDPRRWYARMQESF